MDDVGTHTDDEVADALDALGRATAGFRRMLPHLTLEQLDQIARCCPWEGRAGSILLDLDSWVIVAAYQLRTEEDTNLSHIA